MKKRICESILVSIVLVFITGNLIGKEKIDKTPFTTAINALWEKGKYDKVLQISRQILKKDPQNIMGLLIKLKYKLKYWKINDSIKITKSITKNIENQKYETKHIKKFMQKISMDVYLAIPMLSQHNITDKKEISKLGYPFSFLNYIQAAEKDGLLPEGIKYPHFNKKIKYINSNKKTLKFKDKIDKTPFSTSINKLWRNAERKKVFEIGNEILKKDPQNIIGLFIKIKNESTYLEFNKALKTAKAILKNIKEKKYETKNIKKDISLIKSTMQHFITIIPHYPESEREADLRKANMKGKDLSYIYWIKSAEKDGLLPEGIKYPHFNKKIKYINSNKKTLKFKEKIDKNPFSTAINTLWRNGETKKVFEIANEILKKDSQNFIGLLIKVNKVRYLKIDESVKTAGSILENINAQKYQTKNIKKLIPIIRLSLQNYIFQTPLYNIADLKKSFKKGQELLFLEWIRPAEKDGLLPKGIKYPNSDKGIKYIKADKNLSSEKKIDKTPFSTALNTLWKKSEKKRVFKIAKNILKQAPLNIIGLLIKMNDEVEHLKYEKAKKTAMSILNTTRELQAKRKIKHLGQHILYIQIEAGQLQVIFQNKNSPLGKRRLSKEEQNPKYIKERQNKIAKGQNYLKEIERKKAKLKGVDFIYIDWIKAAEKDGLLPDGIK